MTNKTIASRYARALLNSALADKPAGHAEGRFASGVDSPDNRGKADKIRKDLKAIQGIYQANPNLPRILEHPMISQPDKKKMLNQALAGNAEPLLIHFIELLIAKKRISILPDIAEIYNHMADESLGIIKARVRTPFPITESQQIAITDKLARLTKKQVIINIEIKPELLGGISIKIGDQVMDGSVQASLRNLKEKLLEKA